MSDDIYLKLRERLDNNSIGFPATKSGVELEILKKLFTKEDAEMFLLLSPFAEVPKSVAKRTVRNLEETVSLLKQMSRKGLVFHIGNGEAEKYAAVPFMPGIWEYQGDSIDQEMADLFEKYREEGLNTALSEGATFMRPIPVKRSVDAIHFVSTHDDSREIIKKQKLIAVANCICRYQQGLLDKACNKPLEVCLVFGSFGQHLIDLNMARPISVNEALEVLDRSERAGLVAQPANAQNPSAICNCCGDCCAVLVALNKQPRPASLVISNYYAVVDSDLCTACEICVERCQMEAIGLNGLEGVVEINIDRCIGCGLCVTTCPDEALKMESKPEERHYTPPKKARQVYIEMAKKRGKKIDLMNRNE